MIIADDYGLGPAHDRVIRELVAADALDGVSVMVEDLPLAQAEALAQAAAGRGVELGLHLNLTEARASARPEPIGRLLARALSGRLDRARIAERISAQRAAFARLFGRAPDYVDGHQHCHALPGVAEALIAALQEALQEPGETDATAPPQAPQAGPETIWVRCPCPRDFVGARRALRLGGAKTGPAMALGARLRRRLRSAGIPANLDFEGFLRLDRPDSAERGLAETLAHARPGAVIMTHPGAPEDPIQTAGHAAETRGREAALLRGGRRRGRGAIGLG